MAYGIDTQSLQVTDLSLRLQLENVTGNDPDLGHLGVDKGVLGCVHKLYSNKEKRSFARKVKPLTPLTQTDIQSEHEKLKAFSMQRTHKNLVSVHRDGCLKMFSTEQQLPFYYIDMELGEESLSHYIANRYSGGSDDGISNREVWSIVQQIASGAKYLHGKDIFGAYLKPDNIVRSNSARDIWKITDYCASNTLMILSDQPQYNAPEDTLRGNAEFPEDKHGFGSWSLACILCELNTGQPAFPNLLSLMDYYYKSDPPPQISEQSNGRLSVTPRTLEEEEKTHLSTMWKSVRGFADIDMHLIGEKSTVDAFDSRLFQINSMVSRSLSRTSKERPTLKQIEIHSSANVVRSKLEDEEGYMESAIELIQAKNVLATEASPESFHRRWQFLVKIEPICCNSHREVYPGLIRIIQDFQTGSAKTDDSKLRSLLEDDSVLVKEFKSTFLIHGAHKKTTERQDTASTSSSAVLLATNNFVVGTDAQLTCKEKIGNAEKREIYKILNKDPRPELPQVFARKIIPNVQMNGSSEEESIVQRIHKMWIDGRHANLIRVYRHGPIQGSVYTDYAIDMELCDYNLETYLNKEQDLPTCQIYFIMSHLTEGIRFLHEQEIVYGRLKPKNALFSGEEKLWKIAEYAYDRNSERSQEGQTTRTKANRYYMAPEQVNNLSEFTYKADIWALGCILYELATPRIGLTIGPRAKFQTEAEVLAYRRDEMTCSTSRISPNAGGSKTARLIQDILRSDESQRPTAAKLLAKLSCLISDENRPSLSSERSHSPKDQITQASSVHPDGALSNVFIELSSGNENARVEVESPVDMTYETSQLRRQLSNGTVEQIPRKQMSEVDDAVVTSQESPSAKKGKEGKMKKVWRKLISSGHRRR